jgi:MSHA pilin protein MshD
MCITEAPGALCRPVSRGQTGFSLVEVIIAIVILAVGVVALLIPITNAVRRSGDPLVSKQMVAVAEAMLEEIELQPFGVGPQGSTCNPCAPTEPNRVLFDHVPNYGGFVTNPGIYTIDNPATPINGLAAYSVSAAVTPTALGAVPAGSSYLISVTVTGSNGTTVTVSGFRTSYY